jgi:hypothetical protein
MRRLNLPKIASPGKPSTNIICKSFCWITTTFRYFPFFAVFTYPRIANHFVDQRKRLFGSCYCTRQRTFGFHFVFSYHFAASLSCGLIFSKRKITLALLSNVLTPPRCLGL